MRRFSPGDYLRGAAAIACIGCLGALGAYVAGPIDTGRLHDLAKTVLSSDGRLLELRLNSEGMWRESVSLDEVDPDLVDAVIAYEDRRFSSHFGVDPLAIARATLTMVTEGRVVSGASSLTMQVARLLRPDLRKRSLGTKVRQMLYALRLERHWSKADILEAYFTLAPYGGNVEGIKAASTVWLQKPPGDLTTSEIGLLVALPQAPERRRPDRYPHAAIAAKNHVLGSIAEHVGLDAERLREHRQEGLRLVRYSAPSLTTHLLDRNLDHAGYVFGEPTAIDADWQETTARILANHVRRLDPPVNGAALVVERKTGYVRSYVGSADYLDASRKGAINYLAANRSPGSTLKPLVYAVALDRRLITEHHVFVDRRLQRDGYAPTNFDGTHAGAITLREALIRSRNVPAVEVLHALGTTNVENKIRSLIGSSVAQAEPSGLSLVVGGFYLTPESLAELYLGLVDPLSPPRLSFVEGRMAINPYPFVTEAAAETIQRLLAVTLPNGRLRVAKTGTSHNRQDALAVLVTRRHLIVVWFGTADHDPTEFLTGTHVALPFAEQLKEGLGLLDPVVVLRSADTEPAGRMLEPACPRLIDYPEDEEWIRTEDNRIEVSGTRRDITWYLNGAVASVSNDGITIPTGGSFRVTAADGPCRETSEVFVELVD